FLSIQSFIFALCSSHSTPTTHTYSLSLHDALPIYCRGQQHLYLLLCNSQFFWPMPCKAASIAPHFLFCVVHVMSAFLPAIYRVRSEEHTSELHSRFDNECRLLLEHNTADIYSVRVK